MSHVFDWDYRPAGGHFTVNIMNENLTRREHLSTHPTLATAVMEFLRRALPMRWGWVAQVKDSDGVVVLSYRCRDEPLAADWWGCAAAFKVVELIVPPMEAVLMEQRAKVTMGVPT